MLLLYINWWRAWHGLFILTLKIAYNNVYSPSNEYREMYIYTSQLKKSKSINYKL